ncbi:MAG TPA: hypothetical protein VFC78_04325 [Tepidisphaeraceae bacterium]|nr:hypothetical protein [Tepidisphaeraceae bacterium]
MRLCIAILAMASALGLASCGGDVPPGGSTGNVSMDSGQGAQAMPGSSASNAQSSAAPNPTASHAGSAARTEGDAPPAGAQFMLFCTAVQGPGHVERAGAIRDALIRTFHIQGWHLIHTDQQSAIYYGYYKTFDNKEQEPREYARAQADLRRISGLKNPGGDKVFESCLFVPINDPDPDAPAAWNLLNTPADSFWSIQIGAYEGSPERKKVAVEAVRELRAKGLPAYYYHGDTISSVCVGTWPRSAIKEQGTGTNAAGQTRDDAHSDNRHQDQPILVTPDILPLNMGNNLYDRDGKRVLVEAPKVEILDPTLRKAAKDYPYHALNGTFHFRMVKGQQIWDQSFFVQIPHADDAAVANTTNTALPGTAQPAVAHNAADDAAAAITGGAESGADNAPAPAQPRGLGKLRSIDSGQ